MQASSKRAGPSALLSFSFKKIIWIIFFKSEQKFKIQTNLKLENSNYEQIRILTNAKSEQIRNLNNFEIKQIQIPKKNSKCEQKFKIQTN
jgi:hypothetical protein